MKDLSTDTRSVPHTLLGVPGHLLQLPNPAGTDWEVQAFSAVRDFPGDGGQFLVYLTFNKGHRANDEPYFALCGTCAGFSGVLEDAPLNPLSKQWPELTPLSQLSKYWPELAPLCQWHLCSTRGPLHYMENSMFWAAQGAVEAFKLAALWPDLPEEMAADLDKPGLQGALAGRLPGLIDRFLQAMTDCGFTLRP